MTIGWSIAFLKTFLALLLRTFLLSEDTFESTDFLVMMFV